MVEGVGGKMDLGELQQLNLKKQNWGKRVGRLGEGTSTLSVRDAHNV